MQIFFTSGIGPVILMNVLEDYIMFLIWVTWALCNFYLNPIKAGLFESGFLWEVGQFDLPSYFKKII